MPQPDDDHAYRAMDLLVDTATNARVQESVFFAVANLLNVKVDLLFLITETLPVGRYVCTSWTHPFRRRLRT
jgi:hypothetical protein